MSSSLSNIITLLHVNVLFLSRKIYIFIAIEMIQHTNLWWRYIYTRENCDVKIELTRWYWKNVHFQLDLVSRENYKKKKIYKCFFANVVEKVSWRRRWCVFFSSPLNKETYLIALWKKLQLVFFRWLWPSDTIYFQPQRLSFTNTQL